MNTVSMESSVKYCRHCGKELEEQKSCCSACGTKVVTAEKQVKKKTIVIVALVFLLIAVAVAVILLPIRPTITMGNLTLDGPKYDPCNFLKNPSLFDEPLDYFLEGLTEGVDYEILDRGQRVFYNIYLPCDFMKVGKGNATLSFIRVHNQTEAVGSARYYFYPEQGQTADTVVYMLRVLDSTFGERTSCKIDALNADKEEYLKTIKEGTQGIYTVCWETEQIEATLYVYKEEGKADYGVLWLNPRFGTQSRTT